MSRISRNELLYSGCYAHVISRSIRKLKILKDHEDFEKFKELILLAKIKAGFRLFHYCLMQTHFHLVVEMCEVEKFSLAIRDLKRSYVYWFHEKYKMSGPVWRERFKSLLIEDERYLLACGRYIEANPVKARLVRQDQDWLYSSARHYNADISDELVDDYEIIGKEIEGLKMDRDEFESGSIIGSTYFKFQFVQGRKNS